MRARHENGPGLPRIWYGLYFHCSIDECALFWFFHSVAAQFYLPTNITSFLLAFSLSSVIFAISALSVLLFDASNIWEWPRLATNVVRLTLPKLGMTEVRYLGFFSGSVAAYFFLSTNVGLFWLAFILSSLAFVSPALKFLDIWCEWDTRMAAACHEYGTACTFIAQ